MFEEYDELVHLSRLALTGRRQDIQLFIRRLARRLQASKPEISDKLARLLAESPTRDAPLRNAEIAAIPTDADSRLKLVRIDHPVPLETEPIWSEAVRISLDQVIIERNQIEALSKEGLTPTRSLLFTGKPGVGKSLAAKWIASKLNRPLVTLDLSAVMSSFLGKTGTNVRFVLDYAKHTECVLLLDEFDAIAKRRDDETEIGELKRLVTVLLQEIDDWPSTGILVAATNHPDLLDPAIWRRFEGIIDFPLPDPSLVRITVDNALGNRTDDTKLLKGVALLMQGLSFSDIDRELKRVVKRSVMYGLPISESLRELAHTRTAAFTLEERKKFALFFNKAGFSKRDTHMWTGIHRDTLRILERAQKRSSDEGM